MASEEHLLDKMSGLSESIDKYMFLRRLHDEDKDAYHRLLMGHAELVLPFIYTPTVGEACQKYHRLPGIKTRGLYLSLLDRGNILEKLRAWPQQKIRVVVVTDGERILGLGDLGTGGMGISEGKITLYTVAAGVDPDLCLPVCLDVGTNNKQLLDDQSYPGLRRPRATGDEYDALVGEFMEALQQWQQHVLVQFEDFGNHNAFRLLDRFHNTHCCFNDDIQGTAAITLAALLTAVKAIGAPLGDQRILFMGAGEAGAGIAELIAYCTHRTTGMSIQEARGCCFFMDSKGLVCASRKHELAHHKLPFAHDMPHVKTLLEAVKEIKPTALIGVSTIGGAFTEEVVRTMAQLNKAPIIFPLSNPTSKSECTFAQAYKWTDGRVLFASGSPFDPIPLHPEEVEDKPPEEGSQAERAPQQIKPSASAQHMEGYIYPSQANNAYVFPAVGLAAILTRASHLTAEVFLVVAQALADLADPHRVLEEKELFPPFSKIMEVSAHAAAALCEYLVSSGAGMRPLECAPAKSPQETHEMWRRFVESSMWRAPGPISRQASLVQGLPPLDMLNSPSMAGSPHSLRSPPRRTSSGGVRSPGVRSPVLQPAGANSRL